MINDELKYIVTNLIDSAKHIATVAVKLINDALDKDISALITIIFFLVTIYFMVTIYLLIVAPILSKIYPVLRKIMYIMLSITIIIFSLIIYDNEKLNNQVLMKINTYPLCSLILNYLVLFLAIFWFFWYLISLLYRCKNCNTFNPKETEISRKFIRKHVTPRIDATESHSEIPATVEYIYCVKLRCDHCFNIESTGCD